MKNASISLSVGRVVLALPFHNHYYVNTDRGALTAVDVSTGSGRRGGHIGGGAHLPGASVLMAVIETQMESARNMQIPNLILGSFDPFPSPSAQEDDDGNTTQEGTDFDLLSVVENCLADVNNNQAYLNILQQNTTVPFINQDRSKNRPMDTVPGDWYKSTVLGGLVLLSEFMAAMGATPECRLMFHGLNNETELRTRNLTIDTQAFLQQYAERGGNPIRVTNWALNEKEGLGEGILAGSMVNAEDEANPSKVQPLDENQAGFFRRIVQEGGAVEGFLETIKTDLETPPTYTYGKVDGIQGLLQEAKRMDGIYRLKAAKEIKLEKTTVIQVPVQSKDLNSPQTEEGVLTDFTNAPLSEEEAAKTEQERIQDFLELSPEEYRAVQPLMDRIYGALQERGIFYSGLRLDEGVWTFNEVNVLDNTTVRPLSPDDMEYTDEDLTPLTEEPIEVYPGRRINLFQNSSVFLMSDDGGIVLGDGYGAEIRMKKGRVSIASAGDLELLPGRDIRMMAPRNLIMKARDRVDVSSTRSSINLKAQTSMQLVSGIAGTGMLTLENRGAPTNSLADADLDQYSQNGILQGTGIMIKSQQSGLSLLSRNMYVGPYSIGGDSTAGAANDQLQCNIVMDSGGGNMHVTGATGSMMFRSSAMFGMRDSVTGMYMDNSTISMLAQSAVLTATPYVSIDRGTGSIRKPVLTQQGVQQRSYNLPTSAPLLNVQGAMELDGGISAKDQIQTEEGMVANDGFNGELGLQGNQRFDLNVNPSRQRVIQNQAANISDTATALYAQAAALGLATQRGQRITDFLFPVADGQAYYAGNFSMVLPRWVDHVSSTETWRETLVSHPYKPNSAPYPGLGAYGKVLIGLKDSNRAIDRFFMDDYPVNTDSAS